MTKNQKGFAPILIFILILILLATIFYFYQSNQKYKNISLKNTPSDTTALPSPDYSYNSEEVVDNNPPETTLANGWKLHNSTNDYRYQISHPPNWSLSTRWVGEFGGDWVLTKGDYEIKIEFLLAYDPGVCIFSDHPNYESETVGVSKCGDYVEIKSDDGTNRRRFKSLHSNNWLVYKGEPEGYYFQSPPISYSVPQNYSEETLKEMDEIISTFQSVD